MKKLIICKTATILCGLLAIVSQYKPELTTGPLPHANLIGLALGLLSAIFGTQWIEYQKRLDMTSVQPGLPTWIRRLLFSSLLVLTVLTANAQTTWTERPQLGSHFLSDVAYGAGRYVAVSDKGPIKVSTDGEVWITLPAAGLQAKSIYSLVYANKRFVAVGYRGLVMTSTDGLTWTEQVSDTDKSLSAVTYGEGYFVAVGEGTILTSTNGLTWTKQVSGTQDYFTDVTYGGGQFVAIGVYSLVQTSPDGLTWTKRTLPSVITPGAPTVGVLRSITAGKDGRFVAVGDYSSIVTSTDGITWTYHFVAEPVINLTSVAYNPLKDRYVAVADEEGKIVTSVDGISWKSSLAGPRARLKRIRYVQGRFLTVGIAGSIFTSTSDNTWYPVTFITDISLYGAVYGNGRYVAVGASSPEYYGLRTNIAVTSGDGKNYTVGSTVHLPNGTKQFNDVAFGNGLFAAVGEDALIQTSADGKVWDFRQVVAGQTLNAIAFGGGQFIAIGDNGFIARSNDGKTWNSGFTGLAKNFKGISYANGQFTAVGQYGAIATSPNGIVWTIQPPITDKLLKSVAYGNGRWVAVGYDGVVLYRIDGGLPWLGFSMGYGVNFSHLIFANSQFVAVGLSGKIYTSPNGVVWTARVSGTARHLNAIMHGPGQFAVVGDGPAMMTSPDDNGKAANEQPTSVDTDEQARVGAGENGSEVRLQATTYPNPVEEDVTVAIQGKSGQPVRLWLVDGQGRTVVDRQINGDDSQYNEVIQLGQHAPGVYLLRVSTADQTSTLKVLKR